MLVLATLMNLLQSSLERHSEQTEQFLGFLVSLRGGHEYHFHAANLFYLIVLDFREDQLLANAQGIIAAAVESLAGYAAEVANAGQYDAPISCPSRSPKFAIDFLDLVTSGF